MGDRSRLAVWLFTALAVVVIVLVALEPLVLASRLRAVIARGFGGSPTVSVRVQAPPWAVFTGALSAVTIEVRRGLVGQLPVDRLSLRLRDVTVDPASLFRGAPTALKRVGQGEGEAFLTQDDVAAFLTGVKGIQRATLRFEGGVVALEGDVQFASLDLRVRLEGRFVVASPTTVDLYVQTLTVSGVQIPKEISGALVANLNPILSLSGLPIPVRIESVTLENGQVRLAVRVQASN
jgi:hypothetical protein